MYLGRKGSNFLKKYLYHARWLFCLIFLCSALLVLLPLFHSGGSSLAMVARSHGQPAIPHGAHPKKPLPHHTSKGINRTHVATLPVFARPSGHLSGTLLAANVNPKAATTVFFTNFENGTTGWTTQGDNNLTPTYPQGHKLWNLVQNPQTLTVPGAVNPTLVTYPDSAGALPAAYSGSHAWWYGDNPAQDGSLSTSASMTYMANQQDWPAETNSDGGTSNGANSASLISPSINLTSVANATLTFATWWEIESTNPAHFDMMYVEASKDGGHTWTSVGVLNPTNSPTGGTDLYPYTNNGLDTPASWQAASVDLTAFVGSTVQVRFRFDSVDQYDNGFRGWLVDDVGVYTNTSATPIVGSLTPNNATPGDSVTITGSGFGTQKNTSTVTFNGIAATTQSWSNTSIVATVPSGATSGPLLVTVSGAPSAAVNFTILASLTLSSPTDPPLTVDPVSGQGFAPSQAVSLYLNGANGTLLATATTDATGKLPATNLSLPEMPAGNYLILAVEQNNKLTAGTTLSVTPAMSTPASSTTVITGQVITLNAVGFASYDTVEIQQDTTTGAVLGYLYCDVVGTCSSTITLPASSVVQGIHILIASGLSSALVAEAAVNFRAQIIATVTKGGPGTAIPLSGTGFAAHETVQVYWGTTSGISEGSATSDAQGNLSDTINAPNSATPGSYTITVARTNQAIATRTTTFTILPTTMTSTTGIHSQQPVTVKLSGFQGSEYVTVTWNTNSNQQLIALYVDATGAGTATFTPPSVPANTYTLTATGNTSGLHATSMLTVGPGIALVPATSNPGSTITVNGGSFTPGETVNVHFQTTSNGIVSAVADSTGAFSVSLTIPATYSTTTAYTVYAVSASGPNTASAPLTYTTPSLYPYYYSVNYGSTETLYGYGLASNETVTLYWAYQQTSQVTLGTVTAASDGSFNDTITVPTEANLGTVTIAAIGSTSKLAVTNSVYEYAGIVLKPTSGGPGTKVKVSGGAFGGAETVTVYYQGTAVTTVTTATNGSFTANIVIPTTQGIGDTTVSATGGTSGLSATATFTLSPKVSITPTTGTTGTTVTVSGRYFSLSNTVAVYWYDPTTSGYIYLGSFNTTATGTFTATITAPSGLTSGNTYYIQAYDGATDLMAQAAFIAQ